MKIKASILTIAMLAALALPALAQQTYTKDANGNFVPVVINTNATFPVLEGPLIDGLKSVATWTNLTVAAGGLYEPDTKAGGGFVMALYNFNNYVGSGVGLYFLNNDLAMPSGQIQLQAPFTIAGKVTMIPWGAVAACTPISGRGTENGSLQGLMAAGVAAVITGESTGAHLDFTLGAIKFTGEPGLVYLAGLAWRF